MTLEERLAAVFEVMLSGLLEDEAARSVAVRSLVQTAVAMTAPPAPLPFPDGPVILPFEVGPDQDLRAVRFESPADAEAWRAEHAELLRTAQQPYVRGGRFYAGVGVPEGMVPLVSPDEVLADARRAYSEIYGDPQADAEGMIGAPSLEQLDREYRDGV
jgi:hypothetical protein